MASVNLSIPLPWNRPQRQDREVAARLAVLEQRRAEREEGLRMHAADVLATWQEWRGDLARLARYEETLVPLAEERTRAAVAAYRGSSTPLTAVLDSRRNEVDVRLERLRLALESARLWARLRFLVPDSEHRGSASPSAPREAP